MNLQSYLAILRRRIDVIAITLALAVLVASLGTYLVESRYRAATTLRLATVVQGSADWVSHDLEYADRLMNTFAKVAASGAVKAQVMQDLQLHVAPDLAAEILANTELMRITVEYHQPAVAAQIANRVAEILILQGGEAATETSQNTQRVMTNALAQSQSELEAARQQYEQSRRLYGESAGEVAAAQQALDLRQKIYENLLEQHQQSQLREALHTPLLTVLDPALPPDQPFTPNPRLNLLLGLVLGLIGGLGLAFLFENLAGTPKLENAAQPLLKAHPTPLLPVTGAEIPAATTFPNAEGEVFRQLYQTIWNGKRSAARRKILFLGVEPGGDKTSVAFNLACTVAQAGQQVVLVDSDFQQPAVHQLFNLPNQYGLGSLLTQNSSLKDVTWINKNYGIHLITSGPAPYHAAEFINSMQMDNVLVQLTSQFDVVLLNGPALGDKVDVTALATKADGLVIVSEDERHWQAREPMVRLLFAQLGVPLLAVLRRQSVNQVQGYTVQSHLSTHATNGAQRLFHSV